MIKSPVSKSFGNNRRRKLVTLCSGWHSSLCCGGRSGGRLLQCGCFCGQAGGGGVSDFMGSGGLGGFSGRRGPVCAGSGIRLRR